MKKIKKSIAVVAALLLMGSFSAKAEINKETDPNTCENQAVAVYYATLDNGGTWQEANENFHNAYTSCCFSYPNDCGGLVKIGVE